MRCLNCRATPHPPSEMVSRLAAARAQNGSDVINVIHYRSAASLPTGEGLFASLREEGGLRSKTEGECVTLSLAQPKAHALSLSLAKLDSFSLRLLVFRPCHPERSVSEVELRSSARRSRAGSRARIASIPLVDPDAMHRPTGSTAGFALRSG